MRSFIAKIEHFFKLSSTVAGDMHFSPEIHELRIPKYQREFKWTNEKIAELINDIISRDKFLGIIILDEHGTYYEIVDGQQRITTCYLALLCLYNRYKGHNREQASIDALIRPYNHDFVLKNESIGNYISIGNSIMELGIREIDDVYYQSADFDRAYKQIDDILSGFSELEQLRAFKQKLLDSQFLVLVNDSQNNTRPVEQIFLDINEKSQLLEQADIFKGHCFKNYGIEYADELKELWVSLKKCAVEFTRWGFKDFDEYLYTYLLMAVDPKMPINLSPNGKHYLDGKSIDETEAILKEMIQYGSHVVEYHKSISDTHYAFEDICNDANNYASTSFISATKQLSLRMLESKGAQYQKLPLLFLIHKIGQHVQDGNSVRFDDFQRIVANLFVYSSLFVMAGARKSKSTIDHSVYDALNNSTQGTREVVLAAQNLRKQQVDCFEFLGNISNFNGLADLYTTMDYYVSATNRISQNYFDNTLFTLEHFVVPDNKNIVIRWRRYHEEISIRLNSGAKQYKKKTINYLILPKALNESLMEYDIVTKIEKIREHYQQESIPKHIGTIISYIERLSEYQALLALPDTTTEAELKEKYDSFVNAFFSDVSDSTLRAQLTSNFKNTFRNEVTTQ